MLKYRSIYLLTSLIMFFGETQQMASCTQVCTLKALDANRQTALQPERPARPTTSSLARRNRGQRCPSSFTTSGSRHSFYSVPTETQKEWYFILSVCVSFNSQWIWSDTFVSCACWLYFFSSELLVSVLGLFFYWGKINRVLKTAIWSKNTWTKSQTYATGLAELFYSSKAIPPHPPPRGRDTYSFMLMK